MDSSTFHYIKPKAVVILIPLILAPIFLIKYHWGYSVSAFGVVTLFFHLINTKLWNITPFKYLMKVDDFSGRYEGEIEYQYLDENCIEVRGRLKQIKIVQQNALKVTVFTATYDKNNIKSSTSINKGMYVEKTEDGGHYRLIYNYDNDGNSLYKLDKHIGTESLKFIKTEQGKFLEGEYFTSRLPHQSRGRIISMECVSNNLKHLIPQNYGSFK